MPSEGRGGQPTGRPGFGREMREGEDQRAFSMICDKRGSGSRPGRSPGEGRHGDQPPLVATRRGPSSDATMPLASGI